MNDMKYPIKYAIEEMYPSSVSGVFMGYIVTKVFVVGSLVQFLEDGRFITNYNVVFPYKEMNSFSNGKARRVPSFHYTNNLRETVVYTNADYVSTVFDSYEEAKAECKALNSCLSVSKELQEFEDLVKEATEDLIVSGAKKPSNDNFDKKNIENIDKMILESNLTSYGMQVCESGVGEEVEITEESRKCLAKALVNHK